MAQKNNQENIKTKKALPTIGEVIKMGLEEGEELLEKLDQDCVKLEKDPKNTELIHTVFRSIHTLKATAGFMMATNAQKLLQTLEKLLDQAREGQITVNEPVMTATFNTVTAIRKIFNNIARTKTEGFDVNPLIQNINDIVEKKVPAGSKRYKTKTEEVELATTIRIDSQKLDSIMNFVGELITGRNQLDSLSKTLKSEPLSELATFMDRIIGQLQGEVVSLRMIPVERIFSKIPRLARDVSAQLDKKVDVVLKGEKTILDKTIIDNLYDPLVHLIRNAISHGIEKPETRINRLKEETGTVKVTARQEQDTIVIEVEDDGQGMEPEMLKAAALRKKLITLNRANQMTEQEALNLIFLPGFSVMQEATDISGRGVGMDVVKTNIGRLNGTVEVSSRLGKGTKVTLKVPLTVIIQTSMEIRISTEIYAIPLGSVQEVFAVSRKDIQGISGKETVPYHGTRLPVVRLEDAFNLTPSKESQNREEDQIVVLKAGDEKMGIIIDEILGREEIVIKPLGEYLGEVAGLAGATVLGTGKAILILDVFSLVKLTKKYQQGPKGSGRATSFFRRSPEEML